MSLRPEYFRYLDHFGKTVTVRELSESLHLPHLVALRHDIDYDLDLALEMSYWEHERGICSTYYLLHTAPYWNDERFLEKCLQIQDFGHEVGLHLNILTEWVKGEIQDVGLSLKKLILPLREGGVRLSGVSTHGDRLCYEWGFINYWCFSELKPSDPIKECGLSAEGIPVKEEKFQIQYPESDQLINSEGERFNLWSISMNKLGLTYEAIHVPHNFYYTDSGGGWNRSVNPLDYSFKQGRHQVLIHPIYWRGEQKIYFFLSTARSGSKWLTNFLEQSTPLTARHELTLNHQFKEGKLIEQKRTADGFTDLVNRQDEAKELCIESRAWIEELLGDYAEANVYLEQFPEAMKEVFPDAMFIHLYRNPKDVIRSIVNRDWYDTPEDKKHPTIEVENWTTMGQFEKACWYVRQTNESLLSYCHYRLVFEQMVNDFNYLTQKLRSWDIPVFPRLAKSEFNKRINANYNYEFPEYEQWSVEQKALFYRICEPISIALGYGVVNKTPRGLLSYIKGWHIKLAILKQRFSEIAKKQVKNSGEISPEVIAEVNFSESPYQTYSVMGCQANRTETEVEILPDGGKNAHFLIGGGQWYLLKDGAGWESQILHYYRGSLESEVEEPGIVQLFALMYDEDGKLMAKRSLGQMQPGVLPFKFAFRPKSNTRRFNLAIYLSASNLPDRVKLKRFCLEKLPLSV
ncbi:MAG TPA: hypothetical protein DD379_12460 [Cyanobacteria bacterium UBA11162]|nr:hypothetical protein [Cyanobacteria bacterium UBA11162]